jgi:cyclophilin family peptidyl-prolyl cis-trans isomerase
MISLIQGDAPSVQGTGGPGYNFDDEIHPELTFTKPYPSRCDGQCRIAWWQGH